MQTTEIDPEYHNKIKGILSHKLEKEMNNLIKIEDSYEKTIEKF